MVVQAAGQYARLSLAYKLKVLPDTLSIARRPTCTEMSVMALLTDRGALWLL